MDRRDIDRLKSWYGRCCRSEHEEGTNVSTNSRRGHTSLIRTRSEGIPDVPSGLNSLEVVHGSRPCSNLAYRPARRFANSDINRGGSYIGRAKGPYLWTAKYALSAGRKERSNQGDSELNDSTASSSQDLRSPRTTPCL